jgi:hypothetical protein
MFTLPQVSDANLARFTLTARCLRQFGFTFTPPPTNQTKLAAAVEMQSRRYGITDAVVAATRGYHPPEGFRSTDSQLLTAGMSATEQLVFNGPRHAGDATTYAGRPIPPGGCDGSAVSAIAGGGEFAHSDLAAGIQASGFAESQKDSRVIAAFAQWSACMAKAGYHYRTPLDSVGDDRWSGPQPAPDELAVARTDLACKAATNLVDVWHAVESELENTQIAAQHAALISVREQRDKQLATISAILGGH